MDELDSPRTPGDYGAELALDPGGLAQRNMISGMPSPWLAVGPETDPLTRARQLQRSWERLLAEGFLGSELAPEATAGLRSTVLESWRRSLGTGLDPVESLPPVEVDQPEVRDRWREHPLGSLEHVLAAQVRAVTEETQSLVVVSDASGLLLHIDGAAWLKERAAEMNFREGARFSEAVDGTNGIGTPLAADHPLQIFAFEHFNQRHHQWMCSGAPVHDPVSGQILGLVDLSSLWKSAHPRTLDLVTTTARTLERCLLDARRDHDARLRRRYSDLMSRSTDLLVTPDGYLLDGDEPRQATPLDIPHDGGEIVLGDGSVAVAEPLGDGEAYLVHRHGSHGAVATLQRAERRARELATEQAALRQVATLVAHESSPDRLFAAVAHQAARLFDVPIVKLVHYEEGGAVVLGGFTEGSDDPFPIGSRWPLEDPGVSSQAAAAARRAGLPSAVATPIEVDGRLWGAMVVASPHTDPLPKDTEARLSDFAELVSMAIANAESRAALRQLADEQAALRRVATLVASGISPEELFTAVSHEVGGLFGSQAVVARFEADEPAMVVVGMTPDVPVVTIGTRWALEDFLASTVVYRTGRPARNAHTRHLDASGPVADSLREMDFVSTVAAPIVVEGRVWGVMTASDKDKPMPPDTEERLARFTELVATAIANGQSRTQIAQLAGEQAALRRIATLVAEAADVEDVFSAVAEEVERVLDIQLVTICRCESDGFLVMSSRGMPGFPAGSRWPLDLPSLPSFIYHAGRPVRIDDFSDTEGLNAAARDAGIRAAVGAPIVVGGSVWGSMCAASTKEAPLPRDAEDRLARFTDLVATCISNATMREELDASRARIVAAGDDARRRIERDLHDGAQQRLVTLAVALRRAESKIPAALDPVRAEVTRVAEGLTTAVEELRELSQGIHPSILTEGGLSPALKALGRRSAVRVKLDVGFEDRLPDQVEVAAYYTVSEALANASKHANATHVRVSLRVHGDVLVLSVRDDGLGGADARRGSGLTGLRDRIEALGGAIQIDSPPGDGTTIAVQIPIHRAADRVDPSDDRRRPTLTPAPPA